jgi:hypothetical protein
MNVLLADPSSDDQLGFHPLQERICSDYAGFARLALLAAQLEDAGLDEAVVDMREVTWFDANMCAPLGSLLHRAIKRGTNIKLANLRTEPHHDVRGIFLRNGFLARFGQAREPDTYGTTVEYQRFDVGDERAFAEYADSVLKSRHVPTMTTALRKWMMESVCEIFGNAVVHSRTRYGIHACGQYYRSKHRLDFSVADVGIGIPGSVNEKAPQPVLATEAIQWAVSGQNTTRTGSIPGGVGLKRLREFITLNSGRMQIASGQGYWELSRGRETANEMRHPFPGTVVNLEFNAADKRLFFLQSELTPDKVL